MLATRGVLREVDLLTVSNVDYYPAPLSLLWASGSGKMGACQGDSGGAMTHADVTVAIISVILSRCGGKTGGVLLRPERAWIDATLATWDRSASWVAARQPVIQSRRQDKRLTFLVLFLAETGLAGEFWPDDRQQRPSIYMRTKDQRA
jgi:hypothetical protein